jgi:hypothetical protein
MHLLDEAACHVAELWLRKKQWFCVQVINAFEMPRHEWDQSHKRFVRCTKPPSIHAEPLSKPKVVLGRLQMLEQCVQRVTRFNAGSSSGADLHVCLTKHRGKAVLGSI